MATYTPKRLYAFDNSLATPRQEFSGLVLASAGAAIEQGQVMAYNTSTSKWTLYANGGANGTGVPLAILAEKLDASASDYVGAKMIWRGPLLKASLVGYDSEAVNDFGALVAEIPGDSTVVFLRY